MDTQTLWRAGEWRVHTLLRQARHTQGGKSVETREIQLTSTAGYTLAARITRLVGAGPQPGLVVSPGIHQGLAELHGYGAVVSAEELAGSGYTVLTFDPAGRGASWGEEDFGGPEHQDNIRAAIRAVRDDPKCNGHVGVLALSLGIAAAAGALARWPELNASFLLDWEGPCDREIITSGGTILIPAAGHALNDDGYWAPREALGHMAQLNCTYIRLQALPDHAQPTEVRHALRMAHAAERSHSDGKIPWFQLNDHPRNQVPARPTWVAGGPIAASRTIRRKLRSLRTLLDATPFIANTPGPVGSHG